MPHGERLGPQHPQHLSTNRYRGQSPACKASINPLFWINPGVRCYQPKPAAVSPRGKRIAPVASFANGTLLHVGKPRDGIPGCTPQFTPGSLRFYEPFLQTNISHRKSQGSPQTDTGSGLRPMTSFTVERFFKTPTSYKLIPCRSKGDFLQNQHIVVYWMNRTK